MKLAKELLMGSLSGPFPKYAPPASDPEEAGTSGGSTGRTLALLRRQYGDWPKAVAAYHFGRTRFGEWLAGRSPDFESPSQRKANEGLWRLEESPKKNERDKFADRDRALKGDVDQGDDTPSPLRVPWRSATV
jgi:hypothetical protein